MARKATESLETETKRMRPALTPEARENQLISLAMDRAEERLRNGTATSQEIVHFLKLGSVRGQIELEKMRLENKLTEAKTNSIESNETSEKLYSEVIAALKKYSGG